MAEVTLKLPDALTRLPEPERERLIRAGLHEAVRARVHQLESEIAKSEAEIARFEAHYGMSLARFEAQTLPHEDSLQVHEDYNDWFYWQSVQEEKQRLLADLKALELE